MSEEASPQERGFQLAPQEAVQRLSTNPGPFEYLFATRRGRLANKWLHYLPFYDRVLAPYRGKPVRLLEIGVSQGGSLELWRAYFGPAAVIYGIDIDPGAAERCDAPNQVRIGSQTDPTFLRETVAEMGGVDIVLDDGSHVASHQRVSFAVLWPLLCPGGLYIIEDMHTAYWPSWEGGYKRSGTAIELMKQIIDDAHGWYHADPQELVRREEVGILTIGDSIAAIEKIPDRPRPGHIWAGQP